MSPDLTSTAATESPPRNATAGAGANGGAGMGVNAVDGQAGTTPVPGLGACCHGGEDLPQPGVQEDQDVWVRAWLKIAIAIVFGGQGMVLGLGLNRADPPLERESPVYWVLHGGLFLSAAIAFGLLGWPLVKSAWEALRQGRISVESLFLLSAMGALGASLVSTFTGYGAVYYEIVAIVLAIYSVGKLLGARSRAKALEAARALSEEFEYAYVDTCCGSRQRMAVAALAPGMAVLVGPGEPIAVDGVITRGEGFVVETAMTGETTPVLRRAGDPVWAGSYSVEGTFSIENRSGKGTRRIDAVLETITQAQLRPSQLQRRSDSLMMWFVPFVATVSISTFVVWSFLDVWQQALFNSMAVLLVACPCALGLATPIAIWSALIKLSRAGLVARTGDFCDTLALSRRIVFDKTGTISTEQLQVHSCHWTQPDNAHTWARWVAAAEQANSHPVARALATLGQDAGAPPAAFSADASAAFPAAVSTTDNTAMQGAEIATAPVEVLSVETVAGRGIIARLRCAQVQAEQAESGAMPMHPASAQEDNGHARQAYSEHTLHIGQPQLFGEALRSQLAAASAAHTPAEAKRQVWIAVDGQAAGIVFLGEALRENVAASLAALREDGVAVEILTGDPEPLWEQIGGVKVHAGLSPLEKEKLVRDWQEAGEQVIFVGDGVNDASAMSVATASIAMSAGAELTRASSTAVLIAPTLEPIIRGRRICKAMRRTLRGNMYFALIYNLIGISLAAFGVLNPVVAALLMLVSSMMVSYRAAYSARKL